MTSVVLFMDVALFLVGVALIIVLFSKERQDLVTLRLTLCAYFLVVLQYNHERIDQWSAKLLLTAAAACYLMWMWQTAAIPEESLQD